MKNNGKFEYFIFRISKFLNRNNFVNTLHWKTIGASCKATKWKTETRRPVARMNINIHSLLKIKIT